MLNAITRRWITSTAKGNFWRIASYYDLEDLIQDGYMVYFKIIKLYPNAQPAQTLRLFQRSYINHIHNLAKRAHKIDVTLLEETNSPRCEYSDLVRTIREAPEIVRKVLISLACKPYREHRIRADKTRQTTNELLCQLSGISPIVDARSAVVNYLTEK